MSDSKRCRRPFLSCEYGSIEIRFLSLYPVRILNSLEVSLYERLQIEESTSVHSVLCCVSATFMPELTVKDLLFCCLVRVSSGDPDFLPLWV